MGPLSGLRPFHRQLAGSGCTPQWGAVCCGASVLGVDVFVWADWAVAVFDCCGSCFAGESVAWSSRGCHLISCRCSTVLSSIEDQLQPQEPRWVAQVSLLRPGS